MFLGFARIASLIVAAALAGCSSAVEGVLKDESMSFSPRVVELGEPVPKGGGVVKIGAPYTIAGQTYLPREDPYYDRVGAASWYGVMFHGRKTSNGEVYDMRALSAAHPTLPMPSYVRVTNLENGRSVVLRVNDRGPYKKNRIIDVSERAAELLDFKRSGTANVRVQYVGKAPLNGDDRYEQHVLARQPWVTEVVALNAPPYRAAPAPVSGWAAQASYQRP